MRNWVAHNHADFERDVLRDFCQAAAQLSEQISRFARTGTVSFSVLRALVGEPMNKGPLWRLKDKAHHIFRNGGSVRPPGVLLDWVLGYIFHESLKLMEDAHQRQFYAPQLEGLSGLDCPELAARVNELIAVQGQTVESMHREVARLDNLLRQSRKLFCLYFEGCADHRPLARLLHDNNDIARKIFEDDYDRLVQAVYGAEPERMHIEAARSLLESARFAAAAQAVEAALSVNPQSGDALELQAFLNGTGSDTAPKDPPLSERPLLNSKSGYYAF